jgi:hypothetical protein
MHESKIVMEPVNEEISFDENRVYACYLHHAGL